MSLYVVDRTEDGPWSASYRLAVRCGNCDESHVALLTMGQPPQPRGEACPHCLVRGRLLYGTMAYARTLMSTYAWYFLRESGDGFEATRPPVHLVSGGKPDGG